MKSFADNGVNGALEGRPKVVLNCSTINKGGGIQSAVSFIRELIDRRSDAPVEWILCLSKEVYNQLSLFDGYPLRPSDKVFSSSPARDRDTKRELLDLVHQFQADAVFTYFGPSYIKFPVLHVCGVADGWTTHSTWESFQYINPWYNKIKKLMVSLYRLYWFTKAGVWIVEQEAARTGLIKRGRVPETAVHVVANNCAEHYYSESWQPFLEESEKSRFLVFSSFYPNKNILMVPMVASEIIKISPGVKFEFVLTLPESDYEDIYRKAKALNVEPYLNNIGPVDLKSGPALYDSCDLLFMPSILETFSAVYPEAMSRSCPIVTSDRAFAKAICGPAAIYFDPRSPVDAARKLLQVLSNKNLRDELVQAGNERLKEFPSPREKYSMIESIIVEHIRTASC